MPTESPTDLVVVRTASTPAEAKVLVAVLQAEGIAAAVDGDSLADEIAISRRAMNLAGIHVRVPRRDLEAARSVLAATAVDEAELEAQALAAGPAPTGSSAAKLPSPGKQNLLLVTIAAVGLLGSLVFASLWRGAIAAKGKDPLFLQRTTSQGMQLVMRSTGKVFADYFDRDGDGIYEDLVRYRADGSVAFMGHDDDRDGDFEMVVMKFRGGSNGVFFDADHDFTTEQLVVEDESGKAQRRQHWKPGHGFVDDR